MRLAHRLIIFSLLAPAIANAMGPAEREYRLSMQRNKEARETLYQCRLSLGETATTRVINAKILTPTGKDPYVYEVLSNNKKLNKSQKDVLREYLSHESGCQNSYEEDLSGDAMLPLVRRMNSEKDSAYADLLSGKVSIADGNKRILQATNDYLRDYDQVSRRMLERAQNEQDANARQDDARRLALIQSIDQSLNRIRSIDTSPSPSFTNCNQSFDSINCYTNRY